MRKTAFMLLVALAILAAAACQDNPTLPGADSLVPVETVSTRSATTTESGFFVGIFQATKAEGWSYLDPNVRRDLVAEGGTVTLLLEASEAYTVTVTMPGETPRVATGRWHYHSFWGKPQIDFYMSSIPDPEYGEIPSFYVSLNENTLTLSQGGAKFLPFDFGGPDPRGICIDLLELVFTRQ